jgi:hypothetical protein
VVGTHVAGMAFVLTGNPLQAFAFDTMAKTLTKKRNFNVFFVSSYRLYLLVKFQIVD